jgi:hypothetical protein
MEQPQNVEQIIRKILDRGSYSEEELDRLFRVLSKQTHPDLGGGDGEAFIRLREAYETAKYRLHSGNDNPFSGGSGAQAANSASAAHGGPASGTASRGSRGTTGTARQPGNVRQRPVPFDPHAIIAEAGYPEVRDPRGSLYIALRWFFSKGMQNYRIRAMKGLRKRNRRIVRTIFHWARIYHPGFVPVFAAYHRNRFQYLSTTWEIKNYNYAKRLFLDGVSGFFNYQFSGRRGTIEVARDKLDLSSRILTRCLGRDHPLRRLCGWFLSEAGKPPCFYPPSS